jgi:hypothetical protein
MQELFSEPEDVHDDSLRNVVCVVTSHNLAHTQLTGQIDSGFYNMLFKTNQKSKTVSFESKAIINSSVVDPDLQGSAFIWLSCIQIRYRFGKADPDPGAWKLTKIYE